MEKMIKALEELKSAFKNVDTAWNKCDAMDETEALSDYPFAESFDEMNLNVENWIGKSIKELREKSKED